MTDHCGHCTGPMPLVCRADAKYCSGRCRVAALRARSLPTALTRRPRWVRYSAGKVPLTHVGTVASSTDPQTWSSYRRAVATSAGVGIGFVLNGDGIVCLDLDHCLINGHPTEAAERFLASLPPTYIEISPSGTGLHVWGLGNLPRGRVTNVDGLKVEAYGTGRYITVTGNRWSTTAHFADLSGALEAR